MTVAEALPPQPLHGQREPTQEAWRQIWNALESRERIQLSSLLRHGRMKLDAADEERVTWEELIAKLDRRWDASFSQKSLETLLAEQPLDPDAKRASLETTAKLEVAWSTQFHPTLQQIARGEALTDPQREVLSGLQSIVDRLAIADVRDDTIWRADDTSAWFRLVEVLLQAPMSDRSPAAATSVSHLQMYRQSDEYRGQLVTFSGTARLVYRVDAPKRFGAGGLLPVLGAAAGWVQPADRRVRAGSARWLRAGDDRSAENPRAGLRDGLLFQAMGVSGWRRVELSAAGRGSSSGMAPPSGSRVDRHREAGAALGPWFWPVIVGGAVLFSALRDRDRPQVGRSQSPVDRTWQNGRQGATDDPAVWDHLSAAPCRSKSR